MTLREFRGILVFIVAGNDETRNRLSEWMEAEGYRVNVFEDSWSCLRAIDTLPDLVIMDRLTDFQSAQGITKNLERVDDTIPLILVGQADTEDVVIRAVEEGAFDYLAKPVDKTRLMLAVRRAAEYRWLKVTIRDLERELSSRSAREALESGKSSELSMKDLEKQAIVRALRATKGNVSKAARHLGLGRTTLYRKMSAYGLNGARIMANKSTLQPTVVSAKTESPEDEEIISPADKRAG